LSRVWYRFKSSFEILNHEDKYYKYYDNLQILRQKIMLYYCVIKKTRIPRAKTCKLAEQYSTFNNSQHL